MNELFEALRQSIIDGLPDIAHGHALDALQQGLDPLETINTACLPAMDYVGEKFGCHDMFLPDVLAASSAMKAAVSVLEPEMRRRGGQRQTMGKVVLGTVRGDIHEIGKSLVAIMLSAAGFEVFDLGISVPTETFAAKARELGADVVGVSALLTTTMAVQKKVIECFDREGLRPRVKVIVGGAPVTRKWAEEIGADGYGKDAASAVSLVKSLLGTRTP
jgi:corrinoid protein of di/trimethylamine methyltransferase